MTERMGLYLMVIVIMISTCDNNTRIRQIHEQVVPQITKEVPMK